MNGSLDTDWNSAAFGVTGASDNSHAIATDSSTILPVNTTNSSGYSEHWSYGESGNASWTTPGDGYDDDQYYYGDYYYLEIFPFEIATLGYVRPILIILTLLTNLFVLWYFLSKSRCGKVSRVLFVSLAFSDTLTGISLLPNSFVVYANDNSELSQEWCNAFMVLKLHVSRVLHTVSVWQTVLLGLQRYMCVCHPFLSARVCTFRKTVGAIIGMYVCAFALHVYHLTTSKIDDVTNDCRWFQETPCEGTCVYLLFSIVFQHLLPVILLFAMTFKTVCALKTAQRRTSGSVSSETSVRRKRRERIITITTTLIVICFLIPELPHGIYKLVYTLHKYIPGSFRLQTIHTHSFMCVYETLLIISFNANFCIYCAMMRDFRHYLLRLLTCGAFKLRLARVLSRTPSSLKKRGSSQSVSSRSGSVNGRKKVLVRSRSNNHSITSGSSQAAMPLKAMDGGKDKVTATPSNTLVDDVFV